MELVNKVKLMALDLKAKILGEEYITFEEAVAILHRELKYPEDRALHFVKRFDHNNDGRLSATEFSHFKFRVEEAKVKLVPKFKEYDRDGNGYITLDEASTILQGKPFNFPPDKVVLLLKKFDRDGNGKLDIEEFADFYAEAKATNDELTKRFDELDKDHNGVLSEPEVVSVIRDMMGVDDQRAMSLIQMFDRNQDGNLDKTEFMQLWTNMFGGGGSGGR
jgi:Ca2+-binding EF-hand superfamily protein